MFKKYTIGLLLTITAYLISCSVTKDNRDTNKPGNAGWVVGDYHEHSHFSDGGLKLDSVFAFATKNYGVNFMVNTDHGGAYPRNWDGKNWSAYPDTRFEGSDAG